jgi:Sin3 binding region of histone deacetylase complex subunit SAP30
MAKATRAPANGSPSAVATNKKPATAAVAPTATTTSRARKTTARERDRDRDRKRDRTGAAKSSPKNHITTNGESAAGSRRTPNPAAVGSGGRQRNPAAAGNPRHHAAPSPLIGAGGATAGPDLASPTALAAADAAAIAAASASTWQHAPQRVLHAYRAAHRLRAPAAQRHPLAHSILGHGIGRRAPSSRAPGRGFGGFLLPPPPVDSGGGSGSGSSNSGGSAEGGEAAGGWTRSRQERGLLAAAVRRHFNSLPVSELDVLVETLYRAKTKGRRPVFFLSWTSADR